MTVISFHGLSFISLLIISFTLYICLFKFFHGDFEWSPFDLSQHSVVSDKGKAYTIYLFLSLLFCLIGIIV